MLELNTNQSINHYSQ